MQGFAKLQHEAGVTNLPSAKFLWPMWGGPACGTTVAESTLPNTKKGKNLFRHWNCATPSAPTPFESVPVKKGRRNPQSTKVRIWLTQAGPMSTQGAASANMSAGRNVSGQLVASGSQYLRSNASALKKKSLIRRAKELEMPNTKSHVKRP